MVHISGSPSLYKTTGSECFLLSPLHQALEELTSGGVAVFSTPQKVFSMCERADLLGPAWDLDHSSLEV